MSVARLRHGLGRGLLGLDALVAGLTSSGLSCSELEAVTLACYAQLYHPTCRRSGLFPWEEACLDRFWPPSGSVLIIGAGLGRELAVLEARGYEVWAIEPCPSAVARCQARTRHPKRVIQGGFRELADAFRGGASPSTGMAQLKERRFDSVIFGWAALNHCFGQGLRDAVFSAIRQLCPDGPVLMSFFVDQGGQSSDRGRGFRLGLRAGKALRRVRKHGDYETLSSAFSSHAGVAVLYDHEAIEDLAEEGGWSVALLETGSQFSYPHAVFVPRDRSTVSGGQA